MKNFKMIMFAFCLLGLNLNVNAELISKTDRAIEVSVNDSNLICEFKEVYAHAGSMSLPMVTLDTEQFLDNHHFSHETFTGQAYLPSDVSCNPVTNILMSANGNGKVSATESVSLYRNVYQDRVNGPVTAVEIIEVVRLTFTNSVYIESTIIRRK